MNWRHHDLRQTHRARQGIGRTPWTLWTDQSLLDIRMCDLGITLEGTWIEDCVSVLYHELNRRGLRFRPHVWLSHDWFSPEGIPGFAIPFYLAHPRLVRLERRQMLEVEGGTREECLKILRHECGHALQHAYQLQRRRSWQALFGASSQKYPERYQPDPASRRYVQHLRLYYAQSHPDEDFAETFAVWLNPHIDWRKRYIGWPVIKKLEYVDRLIEELTQIPPVFRSQKRVDPVSTIKQTLRDYYAEKQQPYMQNYSKILAGDLKRLFSDGIKDRRHESASAFLRRHSPAIRRLASQWTGEYQFPLQQALNHMIHRCREMQLHVSGSTHRLRTDVAIMLTIKTMLNFYSQRTWVVL